MAITAPDIEVHLSGGNGNTDPNASLGGIISTSIVPSGTLHNIYDKVIGDESNDGDVEYRVVYIKNDHATLTAERVKVYFTANNLNQINVGIKEDAGIAAGVLATEETAPTGVVFSNPQTRPLALVLGDIPAGEARALYLRRTIAAGTGVQDNATASLEIEADTAE